MADHGAQLQAYNNELVKYLEDLRDKVQALNQVILREEEERARVQSEMRALQERLDRSNASLERKYAARSEFERTIKETESAYLKILESSQTLLHVLKRESQSLSKQLAGDS
eukprot:m51a1_g474 putative sjoegren syndrome nuclear autoantigen 1 homolog (112) ;mRNA; r:196031-196551